MKKISTRVYRENFTEIGVTSRHFVTGDAACDHVSMVQRERRLEPVTRRYRPASAALDELVDALYQLLMDAPGDLPVTASAPGESDLLSGGARARNVS
jgi:hypothetical protein